MGRSRYDELHDQYQIILTNKSGTRYERLAAVVFTALDNSDVVIHDLKVAGKDTGVKHQIDVYIERGGTKRRILVECKDYDVGGEPVGLGVIRDFWGVVDDVHPDEAWVITCNYFTQDARKFAKGKSIKLATLRAFADSDWQNRVHTIITNIVFQRLHNDRIDARFRTVHNGDDALFFQDLGAAQQQLALGPGADPSQIYDGHSVRSITEIVAHLARQPIAPNQSLAVEGKMCDGWVSGDGRTRYPIAGFSIAVPITQTAFQTTIKADQAAAKLLLLDEEGLDFVLWDAMLEGYTVDEQGQVHLAPASMQMRLVNSISSVPVPGATS